MDHMNWLKKGIKGGKPGNITGLRFSGVHNTPGAPKSNGGHNLVIRKYGAVFEKLAQELKNGRNRAG